MKAQAGSCTPENEITLLHDSGFFRGRRSPKSCWIPHTFLGKCPIIKAIEQTIRPRMLTAIPASALFNVLFSRCYEFQINYASGCRRLEMTHYNTIVDFEVKIFRFKHTSVNENER